MWAVLPENKVKRLFESKKMMPRYAVRSHKDKTHIYCIASSSAKEAVVKVGLSSGESGEDEKIQTVDIFESISSRILAIEPDPEDHRCLFLISDDENIYKVMTNVEGKATIVNVIDKLKTAFCSKNMFEKSII